MKIFASTQKPVRSHHVSARVTWREIGGEGKKSRAKKAKKNSLKGSAQE